MILFDPLLGIHANSSIFYKIPSELAMKIIQDLWIILQSGPVLFKRLFDERLDPQLFGGFMSAINSFASEFDEHGSGLSLFEISGKRYAIMNRANLIFVGSFNKKLKEKKAVKELEVIADKFLTLFPPDKITNWDGNAYYFDHFKEEIKDSLETFDDKFQQTFWG